MNISNRVSSALFKVWKCVPPSLSERYQHFDTRMFLDNEMCPQFPREKYEKKKNPYFKKWGFDVSQLDAEYYSYVSGIKADHYVTRSMAVHYIYPYLDRYDFLPAYMDKNVQKTLLGLPDSALGILAPEDVVYNSNGVFFLGDGIECTMEAAVDALAAYGADTILKPTVETYGGHGVILVPKGTHKEGYKELMKKYKYDFTFQKLVVQHSVLAQFNPTSVNTIRVVTYRKPSKERKILYACIRFGGEGSVMDNVCSGGGWTGVNLETGELIDRKRYCYFVMDVPKLTDNVPNEIPCWERVKDAALTLHGRLPQLDIVGWDFSVTPDGLPVLIEFNPRPGVGLQQAVGPMFSKEDMDELMVHVSKVTSEYVPLGVIKFKDRPDKRTVHFKFRGM